MSDESLRALHLKLDALAASVAAILAREDIVRPDVYRRLDDAEERLKVLERHEVILARMADDIHLISAAVHSLEIWRAWILGGAAVLGLLGGAIWQVIGKVLQ